MNRLSVFQCDDAKILFQNCNVRPMSYASIALHFFADRITDCLGTPIKLNVRPLPQYLLPKVSRRFHFFQSCISSDYTIRSKG